MKKINIPPQLSVRLQTASRILSLPLRAIGLLLGDLIYLLVKSVGVGIRGICGFFRRRQAAAENAVRQYRTKRSILHLLGSVVAGESGILRTVLRFAVPLTSCALLWTVVQQGMHQQYGVAVAVDGKMLGIIENESAYMEAEEIVRRRLDSAEDAEQVDFSRRFQLQRLSASDMLLTAGQLAELMMQNAGIELTEGYGVYVNDVLQGVVTETHPIEAAMTRQLSAFCNKLGEDAEQVHYADTVRYEFGLFPSERFTDAQKLANKLTAVTHSTRIYTAVSGDTVKSVAARFSVTQEELYALNDELPVIIPYGRKITVPVTVHYMPIVYTRRVNALAMIDFDTVRTETNSLPEGREEVIMRGTKGERRNHQVITYTDGVQTAVETVRSVLTVKPIDREIAVGTFKAQPYSTDTVIDGIGKYVWPVDGGRITCPFGSAGGHIGLDIGAAEYSEIYAADGGVVQYAGWEPGYGNFVILLHDDGYQTVYGHCVELLVNPGLQVQRGDVIALVGSTGDSTGPHLHFEVRENGVRVDPALYLRVNAD
ncbi:MAG: peptidoglycan DD-metalloendopeptidase family protein [Oscillospiraceae bacterium]|nr:peptidoglycan DD-metalloendopeptidase family protein [Oscillospiraceae bacterium]